MDISIFLAQAFGIYFIVMGLGVLRFKAVSKMVTSLSENLALKFIVGLITLILGILLVLAHNIWEGPAWQMVVTVIAWITFFKALLYIFAPNSWYSSIVRALNKKSFFIIAGTMTIAIGVWLSYVGFGLGA